MGSDCISSWSLLIFSLFFVQNNYTKTECVYRTGMVQVSQDNEQREATFNITSRVKQPNIYLFIFNGQ